MRTSRFFRYFLATVWFVGVSCLSINLRSTPGSDSQRKGLESRAIPGWAQWLAPDPNIEDEDRREEAAVEAANRDPVWVAHHPADESGPKTSSEIRQMAKEVYELAEFDFGLLKQNNNPPPAERSGSNLVAVLSVPGMGTYICTHPKRDIMGLMSRTLASMAPSLNRERGTAGNEFHVEDAVIYRFEMLNPGWLSERMSRFPDGTRMAIYGKYDVRDDRGDRGEAGPKPPCSRCTLTFSRMNIHSVGA